MLDNHPWLRRSGCHSERVLQVRGLRKTYGDVVALAGIDLDVAAGEVVALLGPNGAGKTTLVSIVAGLRRPDAGTVAVDGLDVAARSADVRQRIGLAPQDTGLYPVVSVRRNLMLFGELSGLFGRQLRARIEEVADQLDMTELLDRRAGELSGGQKRRLHTAIALLHAPRLLLLDEATTGADVETRTRLLDFVRATARDGAAVLYSTHYLAEVEQLDSRVVILDHGRVIADGPVRELVARHAQPVVELAFSGEVPDGLRDGERTEDGRVRIPSRDPAATLVDLLPRISEHHLASVEIVHPNLEAVYLALTGRRYDEADTSVARGREASRVAAP